MKDSFVIMESIGNFIQQAVTAKEVRDQIKPYILKQHQVMTELFDWMQQMNKAQTMISIEPVLAFDPNIMLAWIKDIRPKFVSIGADSKGHKLPEPGKDTLTYFISELKKITEVKIKNNLKRIVGE